MKSLLLSLFLICLTAGAFAQERETYKDDYQAERDVWFYGQRAYPAASIPFGARLKAFQAVRVLDEAARARRLTQTPGTAAASPHATLNAATWTLIGPQPTNSDSVEVSSGRVNAVVVDPRDGNTVLIGGAEGGIWKTSDGGVTWTALTDDQPSLAVGALALDPSNPDTIYVGTGEQNFSYDSYYGVGILKSTDAGQTWTNYVGSFLHTHIGALAVHPSNGQILLAGASSYQNASQVGIFRSADGGQTWRRVLSGAAGTAAAFDPTDGNIAYAALGDLFGESVNGVYKSTDAGVSWLRISGSGANSLPSQDVGRITLAIAPSTPSTIYAAIQNTSTDALLGVYKTTDSGSTWNKLPNAPDVCQDQCWYDMALQVHPTNPGIVFLGGGEQRIGTYAHWFEHARTLDGGATWTTAPELDANGQIIHPDQHAFAFTPDGTKLYIGNDGGMNSTTDITSPAIAWTNLNDTLALTQFYPGFAIHPSDATIALGGTQDNQTQLYGGSPSSWITVDCGDAGWNAFDNATPTIAYTTCTSLNPLHIRRSVDGGNTFFEASYGINTSENSNFIPPFVLDPSNPQNIYYGTYRVWQSRDSSGRYVAISPDLTLGGDGDQEDGPYLSTIAVAPTDSNVVYTGSVDGAVEVSTNALLGANATWTKRSAGLPTRSITQVVVDPVDPGTAYALFSGFNDMSQKPGHIFKTTNFGASWTDDSGNLPDIPVNDLVIDPDTLDTLYAATDVGVLGSTDGGATWSTLGSGLPHVVVLSLVLHRPSRTVRAATHGRSVWDLVVPLTSPSQQPTISSLTPDTVNAGSGAVTITVNGTNFTPMTVVNLNGQARPTQFVSASQITVTLQASDVAGVGRDILVAFTNARGAGNSNDAILTIGPAPAVSSGGVVNAANPLAPPGLAPGSIASIFGTNFAGTLAVADAAPPLPFTLGGVLLSIPVAYDGVPLFFVSPNQINFQVPWAAAGQTTLTVNQGTLPGATVPITIVNFAPALFTINEGGSGQGAVLISSDNAIAAPSGAYPKSHPAKAGDTIELYATGLGVVTNEPIEGSPALGKPLSKTRTTPTVTIGGVGAVVSFSGLAPNYVGLYQINVQVPATAPTGSAVPVVLTIGGVASNTETIAIE